jgi:mannosyltransferase
VLVLSLVGGVRNVVTERTQAAVAARAIHAEGRPGDTVAYCPDQLGPAVDRLLGERFEQVTYPRFERPERVDWVDYADRLAAASPEAFADELSRRAGDGAVFVVWDTSYTTHEGTCEALVNQLFTTRPEGRQIVVSDGEQFFERESVYVFPAPAAGG